MVDNWIFDLVKTGALLKTQGIDTSVLESVAAGGMLQLVEAGEDLLKIVAKAAAFDQQLVKEGLPDRLIGGTVFDIQQVQLMAPIPRPKKNIICLGLNYRDHWAETAGRKGEPLPSVPVFFTKAVTAVAGPFDNVTYPASTQELDYEIELAFVIGKTGKNIPREKAHDHIIGYTIMNDVTARDLQRTHGQWFRSKSLDTFAPMGPYLVTREEIPESQHLDMTLRVNGEVRQRSNTSNMIFKIDQIVEILSTDMTLEPGDIIATGTPAGVGVGMTPPKYLRPGDVVELVIERLGTIRNKVVAAD